MAVADSWEHTWRSGMIVSGGDEDDGSEAGPTVGLTMRLGLLVIVGLVAIGALTTRVRLGVLQAEQRRLVQEIADMEAMNALIRWKVAEQSSPEVISGHAKEEGLVPPASIAEIGPPTTIEADGEGESGGVGAQVLLFFEEKVRDADHWVRNIIRGPGKGP